MILAGLGDLVLMRHVRQLDSRPADSLLDEVARADLALANLEVPLTAEDNAQRPGLALRGDPGLIPEIARMGIGAVTLANNHCGDLGWAALAGLARDLEASGVATVGIGADREGAFAPRVIAARSPEVAVVAATCVAPAGFLAGPDRPGMAGLGVSTEYRIDKERASWEPGFPARARTAVDEGGRRALLEAVAGARARTPVVVALMHWGVSHVERPEDYQRSLGRDLIEAGASMVFGCHAHVLQGVEVHRGAPIFHGLGGFIFHYEGEGAARFPRDTAVAMVEVGTDGHVSAARLVLGRLDSSGEPLRCKPARAQLLSEILARNSTGWGANCRPRGAALEIDLT